MTTATLPMVDDVVFVGLLLLGLLAGAFVLLVKFGARDLPAPNNVIDFPARLREVVDEVGEEASAAVFDFEPVVEPVRLPRVRRVGGGFRAEDFGGAA